MMHISIHRFPKVALAGLFLSITGFLTYVVTSLALGDGTIDNWKGTTPLDTARRYFVTVYGNGHLYALGGADSAENALTGVEMAAINLDGTINDWQSTMPLNTPRRNFAATQVNGYIYVMGGYDGSQSLASVERAKILADSSLSPWESMSELTLGRSGLVTVTFEDNIYVVGGSFDGIVERARINSDGTLSSWQTTSSLSTPRGFLAAVVAGEYLYAIGGQNSSSLSLNSVERAHINSDGSLDTWQAVSSMQNPRCSLEAIVVNSYIYALGGSTCTIPGVATYDDIERALIHMDGSLGPWESTTISLNIARRNFAIVKAEERYLYALGGENNPLNQPSLTLNSVERTTILWKLYLPIIIKRHSNEY